LFNLLGFACKQFCLSLSLSFCLSVCVSICACVCVCICLKMSKAKNRMTKLMQNTAAVFKRSYTFEEAMSQANGNKTKNNWIFPPDTLTHGQIEFSVKYLGSVAVAQSKGIDVIKEAVQKLRFNLQLNRSHGYKLQKVLIQISIYGITLVDVKTKVLVCQHALHRISFCADDKQDKRVFAYIVKRSAESSEHDCHVFLCNKVAEEITLTVGEAFDLAYRRFLENNGKDLEVKKQLIILRKRVQELEEENSNLKHQLAEQQRRCDATAAAAAATAVKASGLSNGVLESDERCKRPPPSKAWESFDDSHNPVKVPPLPTSPVPPPPPSSPPPPLPARPSLLEKSAAHPEPFTADPFVVIDPLKHPLEALVKATGPLQPTKIAPTSAATVYDPEFDPRAEEQQQQQQCYPLLASSSSCLSDLLGDLDLMGQSAIMSSDATTASSGGCVPLNNTNTNTNSSNIERMMHSKPSVQMYDQAIRQIDLRLADLREGFSQGISFGKDDFHAVAELDSSLLNNGATGTVGEKAA
ncbi:PTB domain-containing engulfment adapter protein 1, partial [Trichinella papuae]